MTVDLPINEQLDKLTLLMIECYDDILTHHTLLEQCLNEAHLNLSKARSLIGCTNLSLLQIPADLNALVKIDDNFEILQANDTQVPKWFGALPPLSLKNSHLSFKRTFNLISKLCQLQIKLKQLQCEFNELKFKKY
jgi:hypothetical protein